MSVTELMEIPIGKTIFFVGPPGAGKSTFCHQTVLHNIAVQRPVIFVTTEYGTLEAEISLKDMGLTDASIDSVQPLPSKDTFWALNAMVSVKYGVF